MKAGEKYVLLGNFNARVGSREFVGDQWDAVRGHGVTNEAGEELLSFLPCHTSGNYVQHIKPYTSRRGSTPNQSNGVALTM